MEFVQKKKKKKKKKQTNKSTHNNFVSAFGLFIYFTS